MEALGLGESPSPDGWGSAQGTFLHTRPGCCGLRLHSAGPRLGQAAGARTGPGRELGQLQQMAFRLSGELRPSRANCGGDLALRPRAT